MFISSFPTLFSLWDCSEPANYHLSHFRKYYIGNNEEYYQIYFNIQSLLWISYKDLMNCMRTFHKYVWVDTVSRVLHGGWSEEFSDFGSTVATPATLKNVQQVFVRIPVIEVSRERSSMFVWHYLKDWGLAGWSKTGKDSGFQRAAAWGSANRQRLSSGKILKLWDGSLEILTEGFSRLKLSDQQSAGGGWSICYKVVVRSWRRSEST